MAVALLFGQPPATNGNLVFGADEPPPAVTAAALEAVLPALTCSASARSSVRVVVNATLPALTFAATSAPWVAVALAATLPPLTVAGRCRSVVPVRVATALPSLTLAARVVPRVDAALDATLPSLTVAVATAPSSELTLAATLPALTFAALTAPSREFTLDAVLPALTLVAGVTPTLAITAAAVLGELGFMADLRYDPRVERPTVARARSDWQVARHGECGAQNRHQGTLEAPAGVAATWRRAAPQRALRRLPMPSGLAGVRRATRSLHATASRLGLLAGRYAHADAVRLGREGRQFRHQSALSRRCALDTGWQDRLRDRRPLLRQHAQRARALHAGRAARFQPGLDIRAWLAARAQEAQRPPPGRWIWSLPVIPVEPCYVPSPDVVFWAAAGATALLFSCERGGVLPPRVIPVRKVYFVSNAVSLVRLPERTPLPVRSVEVSVDSESWSWGFAANLAASALAAIEPTAAGPVEVELTINDVVWVLLVEAYTLHREFGRESLTIRGRSQSAYLAAPYAPARSWTPATFYTARQLADAELARDGVPRVSPSTGRCPTGWSRPGPGPIRR